MEGYILNNSGTSWFIFKRSLPHGHKIYLNELWLLYKEKVHRDTGQEYSSEKDFVKWLESKHYMKEGFVYQPGDVEESFHGTIISSTSSIVEKEKFGPVNGQTERPPLENLSLKVINSLTMKDIANLRMTIDNPKKVLSQITSVWKLRKAYTLVRGTPGKKRLEKLIRARLMELEESPKLDKK